MPLHIALQMDPLERLNMPFDSSLELARAAAERGCKLFHYEPPHMRMDVANGKVHITARGHELVHKKNSWCLGKESVRNLSGFDVILIRQDPPFDLSYITSTHILDHLKDKVRIINDPTGVRNAPEKLLVTYFPELMPPTLISRNCDAIKDFRAKHGDIIVKPLFSNAGHGIFHLRPGDDNLPSLIETLAAQNNEPWMIQKFLPITKLGDKRIILLDGEPVGAYVRFPAKGDMRANGRVGASVKKSKLTKRDRIICETLKPILGKQGLLLAGIDVIGDYLTEINVTSPTGLIVADKFAGHTGKKRIAERFWECVLY